jgi:exopolysaccharide biosynthesis predicted pyruvyltransferase EpsI
MGHERTGGAGEASSLRTALVDAIRPLLVDSREVVVLGFQPRTNAGDALIWLGQLRLLKDLGISVRDVGQVGSFDQRMLERLPPEVAIVLVGGGNFGDLWTEFQLYRETVISAAAGRRVIQFPQSLCFRDETNIPLTRDVLSNHGDVTLTWRDEQSYKDACEMFPDTTSVLVPDVAFAAGPLEVSGPPRHPVVCIARRDQEGGELCAVRLSDGTQVDWTGRGDPSVMIKRAPTLTMLALERRLGRLMGPSLRMALCKIFADVTVDGAKNLASSAEVVVSDRLHAHVLCMMLGIPHVMVDTRYGKVSSFIHTWTESSDLVELARSPREAIEIARSLSGQRRDA